MHRLECPAEYRHEPAAFWKMRLIGPTMSSLEGYQLIADAYNKDFEASNYDAPRLVTEALMRVYPEDGPLPREQVKVMDVAAGTGLVGQMLYDAGIRQLDALDPCSEMTNVARKRGIYNRYIQDTIGQHRIDVEDNTYDAVVVAGGFAHGHCPPESFDEMVRICKPGGYIINAMRYEFLVTVPEYHGLERYMDRMQEKGKWRRVDRYITDRYFFTTKQGITFVYQKC